MLKRDATTPNPVPGQIHSRKAKPMLRGRAMNYRYTIVTLSELLAVTRDGEKGFSACAEHARSEHLKRIFMARASRRAAAAAELRELIGRLGGDRAMHGAILGAARRGWVNLRAAVTLRDDER